MLPLACRDQGDAEDEEPITVLISLRLVGGSLDTLDRRRVKIVVKDAMLMEMKRAEKEDGEVVEIDSDATPTRRRRR